VPLRALRGYGYLRELLRRPGQPVAALDLVGAGAGAAVESGLGDLLDTRALKAYRQRLRDLELELTEARGLVRHRPAGHAARRTRRAFA
jgi:hypothetical protein